VAGRPPQSATATRDRLRAAWRGGHFRGWVLHITFAGARARPSEPCYRFGSIGYDLGTHVIIFGLNTYATASTSGANQ
jgi:hypothetical protein